MKKILFWLITITLPFVSSVVAVELYYHFFIKGAYMVYDFDMQLGWAPKSNWSYTNKLRKDFAGNTYKINITTNEYGFRYWGDVNSKKTKILFIGDSFTGDDHMSDDDAYYGWVSKLTNAEVFAYGGGGYGSLQQLMMLEKYADLIKPDIFVLQFCSNDYENNSFYFNNLRSYQLEANLRPYWHNNQIIYLRNNWYRFLYGNLHENLFSVRYLQMTLQRIQDKYKPATDKTKLELEKNKAQKITQQLLTMMANSLPKQTKLFSFTCYSGRRPPNKLLNAPWTDTVTKAGFTPLPMIFKPIYNASKRGIVVLAADGGHLSPAGHRIVGTVLAQQLKPFIKDNKSLSD